MNFIKFVILFLFAAPSIVIANVELQINDKHYRFEENPRISDVLSIVEQEQEWYWHTSKLFKLNSDKALSKKQNLVNALSNGESHISEIARNLLLTQVKSWDLADRVVIDIDYDLARFSLKNNPVMEDGKFLLMLSTRNRPLYVFGAVEVEESLTYQENTCIEDTVGSLQKASFADSNYVYVISPNGLISRTPIAYWNSQCTLVMPGSQIYIPVQENQFFPSIQETNEAVARLAINRKFMP
ncbi:MAG: hypothetical protein Alis3KO_38250 [Aliiglaciecola sp.]|uniref:capsule biosynthesis GfcC family protein n=1 Tax=Aliiglaciecola sp. M165 TaxID=2593649 RepID=UPI00163DC6FB|nr:capsule biosynthesis GfcC family protein [Aliiglaciecola sp. M165]